MIASLFLKIKQSHQLNYFWGVLTKDLLILALGANKKRKGQPSPRLPHPFFFLPHPNRPEGEFVGKYNYDTLLDSLLLIRFQ